MRKTILFLLCFICKFSFSQYRAGSFFLAKEYSKDQSLYKGKTFIMNEVLGQGDKTVQFYIDPLAAANSGELTTLVYKCEAKNKEGLILGFYGARWNEAGVEYLSYGFKELPINEANEFLDKIDNEFNTNSKFLDSDPDNNNIYFQYKDISIMIYKIAYATKLRIYWSGFDAEWEWTTYSKTKKRLVKKLK